MNTLNRTAAALLTALMASSAHAQPAPAAAPRKPTVNLKNQAGQPRPGQVLVGQPVPQPPAPTAPAPVASAPPAPTTSPAPTAPAAAPTAVGVTAQPTVPPTPVVEAFVAPTPIITSAPSLPSVPYVSAPVSAPAAQPSPPVYLSNDASSGSLYIPAPAEREVPPGPGDGAPHIFTAGATPNETLQSLRAMVRDEPVRAGVQSVSGGAEWRAGQGAWSALAPGGTIDGVLEVRTGMGASATLSIDDGARVTIDRLSGVTIKRLRVGDDALGRPAPRRLVVDVARGRVVVDPISGPGGARRLVTITTPDGLLVVSEATEVTVDAGKPATHRAVPPSQ